MRVEMLVGLSLSDHTLYANYRTAMAPILTKYQGGFGCDFEVSQVLKAPNESEGAQKINRVFTIYFATEEQKNSFFNDAEYLEVKKTFFEQSVDSTTIIASYLNEN